MVTDRNDLKPEKKGSGKEAPFHFRSHPAALKALIDVGFNLFSLANNHAMDYGDPGAEETLYHLAVANTERAIAFAGLGAISTRRSSPPASTSTGRASASTRSASSPAITSNIARPTRAPAKRPIATGRTSRRW